ncbi:D-aminoacyl-tRNA deacylase [Granulosicoccus sp.]|nr:D-aminoacyl-tRNA deacylase [Granulosicoccus sp.]MDB4224041.1 D-aminoacyl-tRNA deacylase [Granulosicoccus sp.]
MIALIQRVSEASVSIDSKQTASITTGLVALIGVEKSDTAETALLLADKILTYRVFPDEAGKMNLDVKMSGGQILLVPQFTLVADTRKGRRPGFSSGASPDQGRDLFDKLVNDVSATGIEFGTGTFGADMQVALINDGPVTFWLQVG